MKKTIQIIIIFILTANCLIVLPNISTCEGSKLQVNKQLEWQGSNQSLKIIINTKIRLDSFISEKRTDYTEIEINGVPITNNVKFIDLSDTIIKVISLNKDLISLKISGTTLTSIPNEFLNFSKLKSLNLNRNLINRLSSKLTKLKNLESIRLTSNQITDVNIKWSKFKNLNYLNFSKNKISNIDVLIKELIKSNKIHYLHLSFNEIKTIPNNIFKLSELYILNLERNKIKELPCSIGKFKEIEIFLRFNPIKILPDCLKKFHISKPELIVIDI